MQRWLPHAQVHGVLAACDIGLLVRSRSVTNEVASPTKFAEYLHAGLPVLISENIGDLSELVQKDRLGWVHSPPGLLALKKASAHERYRLKQFSREHFTKGAYRAQYERILDRLKGLAVGEERRDPLITIVVPSFNKGRYIAEMIASVRSQTYLNWEMIFIDDASTDGTPEMITAIAQEDDRIRLHFLHQNCGANHCRNLGIETARGDYVIFLDADDLLGEDCLRSRAGIMDSDELDLCVFTMEVFRGKKGDSTNRWIPSSKDPLADFFRHKLPWSVMQPIWRRSFLKKIGGFDESFTRHQDVEFHTRALLEPGVRYRTVISEPDCFYRIAEERKVLRPYALLDGFTESSLSYHAKFLEAASLKRSRSMVLGIIYQTYLQILINFKNKVIGEVE
ncbi:MAG: glycosyltransferase, partial [Bacteroidota bacterium]|nr:glycosyltransferase [Bacteroidota bacterium]